MGQLAAAFDLFKHIRLEHFDVKGPLAFHISETLMGSI